MATDMGKAGVLSESDVIRLIFLTQHQLLKHTKVYSAVNGLVRQSHYLVIYKALTQIVD